jgi:hypothetical protein
LKQGIIYSKDSIPSYLCPSCGVGKIEPDIKNSLSRQTAESVSLEKLDYWEESFRKEILRVDLICSNSECREAGVLVMDGELHAPDESQEVAEILYKPIYIYPAPSFFKLEPEYPDSVRKLMKEAFLLFWLDLSSCGNKVRVGVEELLNEQGVEKEQTDKNGIARLSKKGRPKPIMLSNRLDIFKKRGAKQSACVEALDAIKWLGNESSHSGTQIHRDIAYKAIMTFGDILAYLYKGVSLPLNTNYSIARMNFWYHPDEQEIWPKKT